MKNLIVFATDDNYVMPFCVALYSFTQFHDVSKYKIGLLYFELSDKNISKIIEYTKKLNIELILHKISHKAADVFKSIDIDAHWHFNSVAFYRFLVPSIFSNYNQVLYIDPDIIFTDNIDKLFEIQFKEEVLAAVPRTFLGVPKYLNQKTKTYFAAGLLMVNINSFNKNNILNKVIDFLKNNYYKATDQDALNVVVTNWIELDLRYGIETTFLKYNGKFNINLSNALKKPAIIQFSGKIKPWHFIDKHPYKKLYWKYLRMTPYKYYIPCDLTPGNIIKWMIPKKIRWMIPKKIRKYIKNYVCKEKIS